MNYIIITGANRGLGRALAEELTDVNNTLILIGRNKASLKDIKKIILKNGSNASIFSLDLFNYRAIDNLMNESLHVIDIENCNSIILVNNASIINPIDRFDLLNLDDIEKNLFVNCIAPIFILNRFLKKTIDLMNVERKIINISSGVIRKPLYGCSLYSAGKSAVHSLIETISKENNNELFKIVSFDPGIMNTGMQESIRNVKKNQFNNVEVFRKYHKNNKLQNPKKVASIINSAYIKNWYAKDIFEKINRYENYEWR